MQEQHRRYLEQWAIAAPDRAFLAQKAEGADWKTRSYAEACGQDHGVSAAWLDNLHRCDGQSPRLGRLHGVRCRESGLRSVEQSMARELGRKSTHVAHVVCDGSIEGVFARDNLPELQRLAENPILKPDDIALTGAPKKENGAIAVRRRQDMNPISDDGPLQASHSAGAAMGQAQATGAVRQAVSQEEAQCSRSKN